MKRGTHHHRTPRWAVPRPTSVPSYVRDRAAAPLPPGLWHIEAADAALLVHARVVEAVHEESGQLFALAFAGDKIVAFCAHTDAGLARIDFADVSGWSNAQRWRVLPTTQVGQRVILDPEQMTAMGIEEEIAIELPAGFAQYSPEQRRQWARQQMEQIAVEVFNDTAALAGKTTTPAQRAAYLRGIQPGIEHALEGSEP